MTLIKMFVKSMTFLGLTVSYIIVMVPVFQILFQEDTVLYVEDIVTARTLFDTMIGNYSQYSVVGEDDVVHALILIFHIFVSNIFLLNYLIAILATVYEDMAELGQFTFKSYKYQYIERYNIAMQDKWGYEELVVHPPPVNYLTSLLLLAVFKDNMMLRFS